MQQVAERFIEGLHKTVFGQTRDERDFARGDAAAGADMPRWRQAIATITKQGRSGLGVTIPMTESRSRSFLSGGHGLWGYTSRLEKELGDGWWVQYWVSCHLTNPIKSVCKVYVRPLRPLADIERELDSMSKLKGFSSEDAIAYGRLGDEKVAIVRLEAKRNRSPN